jgi:hypothetical protein
LHSTSLILIFSFLFFFISRIIIFLMFLTSSGSQVMHAFAAIRAVRPRRPLDNFEVNGSCATSTPKSITVVTLEYSSQPSYCFAQAINRAYCKRHGYDFIVQRPNSVPADRHGNWLKIDAVLSQLDSSDFVLYMDGDAYFYNHDRRIEHLIEELMPAGCTLLAGTNSKNREVAWGDCVANTGVFLIRNSPSALELLMAWRDLPKKGSPWAHRWPVEQGAFSEVIFPKYSDRISIVDYYHLNGTDGYFIRHLMGEDEQTRTHVFQEEMIRLLAVLR